MNETVSTFDKNKFEEIRIGVKEYKGFDLIDLRVWVDSKEAGGKVPTAKGLSLNVELFPIFKKAILQLEGTLKSNNLLIDDRKAE
ncbi:MAG: transcriptional regulator [Candidatus Omnitrophica bacterium]|nr:transcriptional regulator [Candidatus Omnitrophota bacterium]